MTEQNAVVVRESQGGAMTLKQLSDRVNMVHEVLQKIMLNGTHYGTVPGCGSKQVLLKPGADLLAMTFRLVPQFAVNRTDMENGHREYDVTCSMHGPDGSLLGQGVGSASTMEKKYRYRKDDNGKRIENEDIADTYNTVLKIAKKRAHIDATLTVTGAADIFTQDLIDEEDDTPKREPIKPPMEREPDEPMGDATLISIPQSKRLFAIARTANVDQDTLKKHLLDNYGIEHTRDIRKADYETICAWAQAGGKNPDSVQK